MKKILIILLICLTPLNAFAAVEPGKIGDVFKQTDIDGVIANDAILNGISITDIEYDTSKDSRGNNYYIAKYAEVGLFKVGEVTPLKVMTLPTRNIKIDFGNPVNYQYDSVDPVVYTIKYKIVYDVFGQASVPVIKNWTETNRYIALTRDQGPTISNFSNAIVATDTTIAITNVSVSDTNGMHATEPYRYFLKDQNSVITDSGWQVTNSHTFTNLDPNMRYQVWMQAKSVTDKTSATLPVDYATIAKDITELVKIEGTKTRLTYKITNDSNNANVPETKILATNLADGTDIIFDDFSKDEIRVLDGFDPTKAYKVESITRNETYVENAKVVWVANLTFEVDTTPPTIDEIALNYGDQYTENRLIDIKVVASDNQTPRANLEVQFSNDNSNWYGYNGSSWQKNHWAEYDKYYSQYDIGADFGDKTVHVRVKDEEGIIGTDSDQIIYRDSTSTAPGVVIITPTPTPPPVDPNSEIVLPDGRYVIKDRYIKLETNTTNADSIQYSFNGLDWSPWEKVSASKVTKYVNLDTDVGQNLKIFVRTRNALGVESAVDVKHYFLDNNGPKVVVSTAIKAFIAQNGTLALKLTFEDETTNDIKYTITVTKSVKPGDPVEAPISVTGQTAGLSNIDADITGLTKGFYDVVVTGEDKIGNITTEKLSILSK
ncbi:MAG: hypothetical protein N4A47_07270 [Clostridia bacterium]|jgi:hypothetical protein|nr:hypothetical protein [Clostridia bacterium]